MDEVEYIKKALRKLRSTPVNSLAKKIFPESLYNKIRDYLIRNKNIRICFGNELAVIDPKSKSAYGVMPVSYWDGLPNFGDVIGPYLICKITGRPALNIYDEKIPGLLTVGSILQSVNRNGMVVWGSGLANAPTQETKHNLKKYQPKILSVRGTYTADWLSKLGIQVPDKSFYGDPALVMPLFYRPKIDKNNGIGLCPHFSHKPFFIEHVVGDIVQIIDVQEDVETVVFKIASSAVCISSSLHGLIIAQAYSVPWIWLEVSDDNLGFDDFKFKDFFSMLDYSQVSHIKVSLDEAKNLDYETLAKKATLPSKKYSEELILDALKKYLTCNQ